MTSVEEGRKALARVRSMCETLRRLRDSVDPNEREHMPRIDAVLDANLDVIASALGAFNLDAVLPARDLGGGRRR